MAAAASSATASPVGGAGAGGGAGGGAGSGAALAPHYVVNDRVAVLVPTHNGPVRRKGFVRFIGRVPGTSGLWFGVELDTADGSGDGTFFSQRYFSCPRDRALFVRVDALSHSHCQGHGHGHGHGHAVPQSPAGPAAAGGRLPPQSPPSLSSFGAAAALHGAGPQSPAPSSVGAAPGHVSAAAVAAAVSPGFSAPGGGGGGGGGEGPGPQMMSPGRKRCSVRLSLSAVRLCARAGDLTDVPCPVCSVSCAVIG
jgi:hypothetical protein